LKTILVIENDTNTLDVIEALLADSDFRLVKATEIIPVRQIIDISPEIIVLDYWLDDGYGTHLCFEIKNNPLTKHIPVLIYSGDKGAETAALECRADAFIEKPFDLGEFESVIKQWTS
jgi:DNA-binding response OmpR family regulator